MVIKINMIIMDSSISLDDIIKHTLTFKPFDDGIDFSKYSLSNMIAKDETAVFIGKGSQPTIDQRNA